MSFRRHGELSDDLRPRNASNPGVTIPLKATYTPAGTILDVEVTIGGQNFLMFLDTGSSDTWLPRHGFQCLNASDNSILTQESCLFAKTYNISPSFDQIQNQTFGVKYGSGIASGIVGYDKVTIGGLTVERQVIGVVDKSTDVGDGNDSGVLGLAYPYLTSAHPGNNYPNDSYSFWSNRLPYTPLFNNLYQQGSVEPYFSLAINRTSVNVSNGDGGFLSLGTLPPVPHKLDFAIAPVEIIEAIPPFFTNNKTAKTYWALSVRTSFINQDITINDSFQALVDCGNFFNFVPTKVAQAVNNAFHPPATRRADFNVSGLYDVSCNAISPKFGLLFGNNVTVYMDPRDMIVANADGSCTSAFLDADMFGAETGVTLNILGTPFLRSVVSVFDFGKDEMRFAERINITNDTRSPTNVVTIVNTSSTSKTFSSTLGLSFAMVLVVGGLLSL